MYTVFDPETETEVEVTRELLIEKGDLLKADVNHEEYRFGGVVYVCGWRSHGWAAGDGGRWVVYLKQLPKPEPKICPIMSYRADPLVPVDCIRDRCEAWFWPFVDGGYGRGYCRMIGPGRGV